MLDGYDLPFANINAAIDCRKRVEKAQGAAKHDGTVDSEAEPNGAHRAAPASILEAIRSEAHDGKRSDRLFEVVRELKRLAWTVDEIEICFG